MLQIELLMAHTEDGGGEVIDIGDAELEGQWIKYLHLISQIVVSTFLAEAILSIWCLRWEYFKNPLLCFDLISVTTTLVLNTHLNTDAFGILLLLRVWRITRIAESTGAEQHAHEQKEEYWAGVRRVSVSAHHTSHTTQATIRLLPLHMRLRSILLMCTCMGVLCRQPWRRCDSLCFWRSTIFVGNSVWVLAQSRRRGRGPHSLELLINGGCCPRTFFPALHIPTRE